MNGETQLLDNDEPVEFEKKPVEVQDFKKITNHLERNVWNILQLNLKKN